MKPKVFIGSSKEKLDIAKTILLLLKDFAETTLWTTVFEPSTPAIESLENIKDKFDFAIFIITADDLLCSRNQDFLATRDNVIFEMGLFIGSIGVKRVYAISEKSVDTKIFSDYFGVSHIQYDLEREDRNLINSLLPCSVELKMAMEKILKTAKISNTEKSLIGLEKIFPTYEEAKEQIWKDFQNSSGPIRLFFQIAFGDITIKGSLYDLIKQASEKNTDIRILHASEESPFFSEKRLVEMGKDPKKIMPALDFVNKSLELCEAQGTKMEHRKHNWPYIWRIYAFEKKLYLMPYFSDKDATKVSPILVFSNQNNSLYSTFVDYFDYIWEQNA